MTTRTADEIIADIESRGLCWSLYRSGRIWEARIWQWPHVVGRFRCSERIPLAEMLTEAVDRVDFSLYPVLPVNKQKPPMQSRRKR